MNVAPAKTNRREIFAWAMFDFANSGYTTVVLTAVFNAYFVAVVAGGLGKGTATLYWTLVIAGANAVVLVSAPLIGAVADLRGCKKRFLAVSTIGCVAFTASLTLIGPGDILLAMLLVLAATVMFATGENLIAAFLPQIARPEDMGRISGYGWSLGYLGGLLVLGLSLAYVTWGQAQGMRADQYVPGVMLIVAVAFGLASLPTFLFLSEKNAGKGPSGSLAKTFASGWARLASTLARIRHYRDLFRFLISLTCYNCGVYTVIVLAAIYAQEVMGFSTQDSIILILVVNVTAAVGALLFGYIQDRLGSLKTLMFTLIIWCIAIVAAYLATSEFQFWIVANLVGLALGSSQSAGRALVGQFTPQERSAEFFGLWGFAVKLSAIIGPLCYGFISFASGGEHRIAILSTLAFFVLGFVLLIGINETRGREAASR